MTIDAFSTACAMRDALKAGKISATDLVGLHAERIERHNPALNAIVIDNLERARAEAKTADPGSALAGLPMTIKDLFDDGGLPNTGGGAIPAEECISDDDGVLTALLWAAGGIVLGKTNSPSYGGDWQTASEQSGRSNSPWNLDLTSGGSTGGGAAAVAAGLSPPELGSSDIGGSIRIPAAFCGIYGHKPSQGILPAGGTAFGRLANPAITLAMAGPWHVLRAIWSS